MPRNAVKRLRGGRDFFTALKGSSETRFFIGCMAKITPPNVTT